MSSSSASLATASAAWAPSASAVNVMANVFNGFQLPKDASSSSPPTPTNSADAVVPTLIKIYKTIAVPHTRNVSTNHSVGTPDDAGASFSSTEIASYKALLVLNSVSLMACVMVLGAYIITSRKYPRIIGRLSLRLCACMAASEMVFHVANLVGYGQLPKDGFLCGFFGGALFAGPSLLSLFYTCSIVLNCQLTFAFAKRPQQSKEKYFLWVPLVLALLICLPTLGAGVYGYDEDYQYCWYATRGVTNQTVLVRLVASYGIWCMIGILYLIVAVITIVRAVFSSHSEHLEIAASVDGFAAPSQKHDVISRRRAAKRRLTYRLLGYITIPIICFVSGVILDLLEKSGTEVSPTTDAVFECLSGMCGMFNGLLFLLDPAILAIKDLRWKEIEDEQVARPYSGWSPRPLKTSARGMDLESLSDADADVKRKYRELEKDLDGL